ncbi:hypothetical protein [Pseudomonas mediterranea]|uniref:hypothetical protein n=1 Tax=Pseudomonas mediterranea TaxID=183795 RepID=UPI000A511125|nr:hypothetical protein [Pseudomonas mediterranea]
MDYPKSVPSAGLVNGKFVDENPVTGTPGSLIPAQWGNSVTEEVLNVIASASITPDEDNNTQLLAAINAKIAAAIPAFPPDASATVKGLVELATDAEVQAGMDVKRVITPASLKVAYGLGDSTLVTDLNNATTGYFYAAPGVTNSPSSGIVFGQTRTSSGTFAKIQTCIDVATRVVYKRAYSGGSWSVWTSIIDSATIATETVIGVTKVATQALTNAGVDDSTIVTPKKLKAAYPAGSRVKAWCNFNGTGTPAIRSASGFSSIVDNGVGDYTLMFATPESDSNFAVVASGNLSSNPITGINCVGVYARSTTSVSISTASSASSASSRSDFVNIDVAVFSFN